MSRNLLIIFWLGINSVTAQNSQIQILKIVQTDKQDPYLIQQCQFKVLKGKIENGSVFGLLQNNELKNIVKLELIGDVLSEGMANKYPEVFYTVGEPLKENITLVSIDQAIPKVNPNLGFSFKSRTAFLGNAKNEFNSMIDEIKGQIYVGDNFEYKNFKGEISTGKISKIILENSINLPYISEKLASNKSISIDIVTAVGFDFSNSDVNSKIGSSPTGKSSEKPEASKANGKLETIPLNLILSNKNTKITIHNLVKYKPDPATSKYDIFKVDYSLDYFIVDATIENIGKNDIDGGELLLRLNFFDKKGQSADEYLRILKAEKGNKDEAKAQANTIDKMVFGGTSKIKLAAVMAKYVENITDYEKNHKSNADKINQILKPNTKVRSIIATAFGVPDTYKIEGIATWSGTFFDKKNLIFAPVQL